jgi:hypothetical protein
MAIRPMNNGRESSGGRRPEAGGRLGLNRHLCVDAVSADAEMSGFSARRVIDDGTEAVQTGLEDGSQHKRRSRREHEQARREARDVSTRPRCGVGFREKARPLAFNPVESFFLRASLRQIKPAVLAALLILGVAIQPAAGQAPAVRRTLALEAGVTSTNVAEHPRIPEDDLRPNIGATGGVSFSSRLGDRLGLRVTGSLSQKGNRLVNVSADIDSKLTLTYLDIPVLGSYALNRDANTVISVLAGAAPAFKLHGTEAGAGIALPRDEQIKIKSVDFGVVIGIEVRRASIVAGVRYTHGLVDIFGDDPMLYGVDTLRNRAFAIYAGYVFSKR